VSVGRKAASYVLPFRADGEGDACELAEYLARISALAEVIVVDGSSPPEFDRHAERFGGAVQHLQPDRDLRYAMGKVNGVITGVRRASNEAVVIADDDVRYEPNTLREVVERLGRAELVVPQNYFQPLPWHARWDTARTLLNRIHTGDRWFPVGDFPGTLGVRRTFFLEIDAYDGDVIFENLQLMRTVRAAGGNVETALDLYVRRLPPTTRQFLSQRVRQAYDDFAIPLRMGGFLSIGPVLVGLALGRRARVAAALAVGAITLAEKGRRRGDGAFVYPLSGSLMAPGWIAERAVCSWLALAQRVLRGGTTYRGGLISRSATSAAELERRYRGTARLRASKRIVL
jgi:glycosyl transferase family 2